MEDKKIKEVENFEGDLVEFEEVLEDGILDMIDRVIDGEVFEEEEESLVIINIR